MRGLNADEVSRMLKSITHDEVPWGLARAIHNQTEGNPLFVQEVIRYLTEQKLLIRAGGKMLAIGATSLEMSIPEGLRDVIGRRLSSLTESCNRLLSMAAVVGREFRLDVLQKVAGLTEEALLISIEEAKRVAIVEERTAVGAKVSYRFAHAFFRTILYEENIAPRRIRLHQQVARALEEVHAGRLPEHAAELAEHFSYSTEAVDLTKAVGYGEMAAQRATDVYDYGEAVRLLQQALKVQEVLDPNDKAKQCDLLTALGIALFRTLQQNRAVSVEFAQALVLADEMADRKRAAMICYWAARAVYSKGTAAHGSRELLQWSERADHYADQNTIERGWVDYNLGQVKCIRGIQAEGLPLILRAIASARTSGNRELLMNACRVWTYFGQMPWSDVREGLEIAEEMATGGTVDALLGSMGTFLMYGRRDKAEDVAHVVRELAATTGDIRHVTLSHLVEYAFALWDGRLDEAVELLERDVAYRKEIGIQGDAYAAVIGL